MKMIPLIVLLLFAAGVRSELCAAQPESTDFPGVRKAMSSEEFEAAGLQKLDPAERAKLDDFIRGYVSTSNNRVVTEAIDKAVKQKKVMAPEIIQSRIIGPFKGYTGRTTFTLENGQRWAQAQRDSAYYPLIDSPPVIIVKGSIGYRMIIAGGGEIRVTQVK